MSYRSVVNALGPVHFPYENGVDEAGNADLTAEGSPTRSTSGTPGAGVPDYYSYIPASSQYQWAADGAWIDGVTTSHTVVWWVLDTHGAVSFANHWAKGDADAIQARYDGSTEESIRYDVRGGTGGSVVATSGSVIDGSWRLFACRYDGSAIQILEIGGGGVTTHASVARTGTTGANNLLWTVAAQNDTGANIRRFLAGSLVSPIVFDYDLSDVQLQSIYDARDDTESGVTGTGAVAIPLPTASFTGEIDPEHAGSLAASAPLPTADFQGTLGYEGTLASSAPLPTATFSGSLGYSGTLAASAPLPTADFDGTVAEGFSGTLSATAPVPTADFAGKLGYEGQLAASAPLPTADFSGTVATGITGTLGSTAPLPTASFSGTVVSSAITGTMAAAIPLPAAAFLGTVTPVSPTPTSFGQVGVQTGQSLGGSTFSVGTLQQGGRIDRRPFALFPITDDSVRTQVLDENFRRIEDWIRPLASDRNTDGLQTFADLFGGQLFEGWVFAAEDTPYEHGLGRTPRYVVLSVQLDAVGGAVVGLPQGELGPSGNEARWTSTRLYVRATIDGRYRFVVM